MFSDFRDSHRICPACELVLTFLCQREMVQLSSNGSVNFYSTFDSHKFKRLKVKGKFEGSYSSFRNSIFQPELASLAQWKYELGVTGPNVPERLVWVNFKFKFCTIISFTFSFRLPLALILWQQILIFTIRYWFWNTIIIFTRTFHDILLKKHWWASIEMKSLYHSIKIVFGYKFYYAVTIMIKWILWGNGRSVDWLLFKYQTRAPCRSEHWYIINISLDCNANF